MATNHPTLDLALFREMGEELEEDFEPYLELFLNTLGKRLASIEKALAADDGPAICRETHPMKGVTRQVGCSRAGELAETLENLAKNERLDEGRKLFVELKSEARQLLQAIREETQLPELNIPSG
ncbi:MAG: Hpt domain-containing protein [Magnetococcales bacterium]|nr:Hpt domain-containing protein [Magnetococcales bacterium]